MTTVTQAATAYPCSAGINSTMPVAMPVAMMLHPTRTFACPQHATTGHRRVLTLQKRMKPGAG
jgi:hypothetical protein